MLSTGQISMSPSYRQKAPSSAAELPWSLHKTGGWKAQLARVERWNHRLEHATNQHDTADFLYAFFQ